MNLHQLLTFKGGSMSSINWGLVALVAYMVIVGSYHLINDSRNKDKAVEGDKKSNDEDDSSTGLTVGIIVALIILASNNSGAD